MKEKEQIRDLEERLELLTAEFERIKEEHDRFRWALRQIDRGDPGEWGWVAHSALWPPVRTGHQA